MQNANLPPIWIVNSRGELGVHVNGAYHFCYKGQSLEYSGEDLFHDDGSEVTVRQIGKREFGETVRPVNWDGQTPYQVECIYMPGLSLGSPDDPAFQWRSLFELTFPGRKGKIDAFQVLFPTPEVDRAAYEIEVDGDDFKVVPYEVAKGIENRMREAQAHLMQIEAWNDAQPSQEEVGEPNWDHYDQALALLHGRHSKADLTKLIADLLGGKTPKVLRR